MVVQPVPEIATEVVRLHHVMDTRFCLDPEGVIPLGEFVLVGDWAILQGICYQASLWAG